MQRKRKGKERKGKGRKGKEREGNERKGKDMRRGVMHTGRTDYHVLRKTLAKTIRCTMTANHTHRSLFKMCKYGQIM